jgi:Trk K+ transport system NAD-binding subunit
VSEGLSAVQANVYSESLADNISLNDVGYLMAMTSSNEVNKYASTKLHEYLGEEGSYIIASSEDAEKGEYNGHTLFSPTDDFISLSEIARDYPNIHELEIDSKESFSKVLEILTAQDKSIPLFIKNKEEYLEIITASKRGLKYEEGVSIVYMGKEISNQKEVKKAEVV